MTSLTIPARPTWLTSEMALRAGARTADALMKAGHIAENQVEDAARDIAQFGRQHMDGYELAKKLDDCAHWNCDREMLDVLDEYSVEADREIKAAQEAWVTANDVRPPFLAGTRVIARWGGTDHTGTIEEVYAHGVAEYAVKADGELASRRMVVPFENVRAIEQQAQPAYEAGEK